MKAQVKNVPYAKSTRLRCELDVSQCGISVNCKRAGGESAKRQHIKLTPNITGNNKYIELQVSRAAAGLKHVCVRRKSSIKALGFAYSNQHNTI